ncbi:hypothetical protein [Gimesia chilikensis]|uniref:hypothetical protein n=1 Tax=Gimesia chilikensis TaxID=2605989 RepID=UPI003A913A1D
MYLNIFTVVKVVQVLLFSGFQQQKSQISRRVLALVETILVDTIRIKKRYLASIPANKIFTSTPATAMMAFVILIPFLFA